MEYRSSLLVLFLLIIHLLGSGGAMFSWALWEWSRKVCIQNFFSFWKLLLENSLCKFKNEFEYLVSVLFIGQNHMHVLFTMYVVKQFFWTWELQEWFKVSECKLSGKEIPTPISGMHVPFWIMTCVGNTWSDMLIALLGWRRVLWSSRADCGAHAQHSI